MKPGLVYLALFIINLIYAGNYTIAKHVMPAVIEADGFIVLRVGSGMAFFLLFHFFFVKEKVDRKDIPKFVVCAFTGIALNMILFFRGLSLTYPINASLIMITSPIIVFTLSLLFFKERLRLIKVVGVLLGLTGAAGIILMGDGAYGAISKGDILVFINAASYACYLMLVKPLAQKYHPITIVKWIFTFGFFMVLPFGYDEFLAVEWRGLDTPQILSFTYVVLAVTILTYLLNATALKYASPTLVSTFIYLQPILATMIALFAGADKLTLPKVLAGVLIFIGVHLVTRSSKTLTNTS